MREIMLIVHFLGLAMGLGTSIGFQFLGMAASKMEKSEALKFAVNSFALGKMAQIGLTLLVISGGYLMTPFWSILPFNTLLILKLSMVFVLVIFLIITAITIKKAKIGDTKIHLKKIKILGKLSLITTLIIVVLAVYIFH